MLAGEQLFISRTASKKYFALPKTHSYKILVAKVHYHPFQSQTLAEKTKICIMALIFGNLEIFINEQQCTKLHMIFLDLVEKL